MPASHLLRHAVRHLRRLAADAPADASLLERFARHRDEEAFTELVERHGSLVRGTSRRVLGDDHAAEDVFQATFLVLARKAGSVAWQPCIGPWLHAVAYRLACKARSAERRLPRPEPLEPSSLAAPPSDPAAPLLWEEVRKALDEELLRLPDRLRAPLVLCYLQGHTRDEAARALGCSLAMLKRRLERGRNLLRERLTQRGLTLTGAGLGVVLGETAVSAAAVAATARAAWAFVQTGQAAPAVAALLRGTSALAPARCALVALVVLGLGAGVGVLTFGEPAATPPAPPRPAAEPAPARRDERGEPLPAGALARLGSVRLRPASSTEYLAFSPNGKRLASLGNFLYHHDRLSIWDRTTGRELRTWLLEENGVAGLIWAPDGQGFVVLKPEESNPRATGIRLWEFTNDRAPAPPTPKKERVVRAGKKMAGPGAPQPDRPESLGPFALSPTGKVLAILRSHGPHRMPAAIELWERQGDRFVESSGRVRSVGPVSEKVTDLAFTPDGRSLLVFERQEGKKGEEWVSVWDLVRGEARKGFSVPVALEQGRQKSLAISPDGRTLALGLEGGTTRLFELSTGREKLSVGKHVSPGKGWIRSGVSVVAFTRDGKNLITASRDNVVRMWDVASGQERFTLRGHHSWPEAIAVSPDDRLLATSGQGLIRLWDASTGRPVCAPQGHTHVVWGVAVAPDGRTVATTSLDGTLRLWDPASGREKQVIRGEFPRKPLFTPDGRAVLAFVDGRLRQWDVRTGKEVALPGELAKENGLAFGFTPDGRTLLTARDRKAKLWDWPAGRLRQVFETKRQLAAAALSPDGRALITTTTPPRELTAASGAQVWDVATGRRRDLAINAGLYPDLVALTPDSQTALVVGHVSITRALAGGNGREQTVVEKRVTAWDLTTRSRRLFEPASPRGGGRYTLGIALSPDGRNLATAEAEGIAALYEVATGQIRRRLVGHRAAVMTLAFSPDGKRLVTTSADHSCLVWDVSLRASAPAQAGHSLPAQEREELWADLAADRAAPAYRALARLAAAPAAAVALLGEKLQPAEGVEDARLDRILANLDSDRFAVRERASAELDRLGEQVLAGVRARLVKVKSEEARRRLERFLETHGRGEPSPERLRQERAIELLEELGTSAAQEVLRKLAQGSATAPRTQAARSALARLKRAAP